MKMNSSLKIFQKEPHYLKTKNRKNKIADIEIVFIFAPSKSKREEVKTLC